MIINNIEKIDFKYKTYRTAFRELLNLVITKKQSMTCFNQLEMAGFTEEEICFAISKECERIRSWVFSKSFWTYFIKTIFKVYDDERKEKYYAIIKEEKSHKKNIKSTPLKINGYIYFIQGVNGGPIKIGFSENVEKRLKALQTASPEELIAIKQIRATKRDERSIHNKLSKYRIRGEWFKDNPEIIDIVNSMKDLSK